MAAAAADSQDEETHEAIPYLSSPPTRPIHSSANEAGPLRPHLQVVVAATQAPKHTPPHLPLYHRGNSLEAQS